MARPTQVTENVYSVARGANIFILRVADDSLALVDAGIPGSTRLVLHAVAALGYRPQQVRTILVTHADIDHVGSLQPLQAATGAQIVAYGASVPYIESATSPPHVPRAVALASTVMQRLMQKPVPVNRVVRDGEVLDLGGGIRVLHTPGHTEDNVCYYWEREGVLFAADLLNRFSTLALTPAFISWDIARARASARRVLALAPDVIGVGHGQPWRAAEHAAERDALLRELNSHGETA